MSDEMTDDEIEDQLRRDMGFPDFERVPSWLARLIEDLVERGWRKP